MHSIFNTMIFKIVVTKFIQCYYTFLKHKTINSKTFLHCVGVPKKKEHLFFLIRQTHFQRFQSLFTINFTKFILYTQITVTRHLFISFIICCHFILKCTAPETNLILFYRLIRQYDFLVNA